LGYVTASARIRRELYEKLKRYDIVISDVIRRALEEEVRRREEEEVARMLDKAQEILARIPSEELVEAIRAGREER
jgi:post-segregation antitoxin (ccd killing protein)